jgi:hypothetical protein
MGTIERFDANQDESTVVYNVPLLTSSGVFIIAQISVH